MTGDDVVDRLQVLVVVEHHEALGRDAAVGGEDQADVDLAAVEGRLGQRSAGVEGLEALEVQPVGLLQAGLAERPGRALGRPAERHLGGNGRQVGQSS